MPSRKLIVDGKEIEADDNLTLIQACEQAGSEIPRFCYHERLSVAGNCRMCLVEWVGAPKPQASCALQPIQGLIRHFRPEMERRMAERHSKIAAE
jgi:NADH dehydrogenase/NADH:ubiquinone oxidoreductase subunit G